VEKRLAAGAIIRLSSPAAAVKNAVTVGKKRISKTDTKTERRSTSLQLIDNMINERRQLLALMLKASQLGPGKIDGPGADLLEEFCQVLVDYIAAGHFGLYERISRGEERRKGVAQLAGRIYPEIEQSTQAALEFNENYSAERDDRNLERFQDDLSKLGEMLTARIELEDQLMARIREDQPPPG